MLTAGFRVGVYEIVGSLGAGAMGEVCLARDSKLGRDVPLPSFTMVLDGFEDRRAHLSR